MTRRVNLIWSYDIKSPSDSWVLNRESFDVSIAIDNRRSADYLILYESKAIIPGIYDFVIKNQGLWKKIFTHDLSICNGINIIQIPPFFPTWIDESDFKVYEKNKIVSMIASDKEICEGHLYRDSVAKSFPFPEHLFGKGREQKLENKIDGLRDYMFSVSMENSKYDTYFTEKILDCFLTGTIPIYWGTDRIDEYFDPSGIIRLNEIKLEDLTNSLYESKIDAVNKNFEIAKKLKFTSGHMIDHVLNIIYERRD